MRTRWLGFAFSALVSAGILWLVARDLDWNAAADAMRRMPIGNVMAAATLIGIGLIARGYRWHYLLYARLPIRRSMHLTILAFLINNILPFRAGDLFRIEAAARGDTSVPRTTALSVAVVERLLDLFTIVILFFIALTGLETIPDEIRQAVLIAGIALTVIAFGMIVTATLFRQTANRVVQMIEKWVKFPLQQSFDNLLNGLDVIQHPAYFALVLGANVAAWLCLVMAYQLLITALFPGASWLVTVLLIITVALAITVPTTIASIGIIEASAILALTSQNYPYDEAFAIGVMVHLCTLGSYTIMGLVSIWSRALIIQQKEVAS